MRNQGSMPRPNVTARTGTYLDVSEFYSNFLSYTVAQQHYFPTASLFTTCTLQYQSGSGGDTQACLKDLTFQVQ